MNKKGTRATNGEGYVGDTIQKIDRKKNRLPFVCDICSNCKDWSVCNYRNGTNKCQKCLDCQECLKKGFCDRFYCYPINQAQISIGGKQTTVANEKKKKDAVSKKKEIESKVLTKAYVQKNGITIEQKIKKIYDKKTDSGIVTENTYRRVLADLKHIQDSGLADIPMQKITSDMLQDFLNSRKYLAQRGIDGIAQLLKTVFNQAVLDKEISFHNNPILDIIVPVSEQKKNEVIAFEISEEVNLIKYIKNNTSSLITSKVTKYDVNSIKNIIILALFTGMRIGELGALNYNEHIDFLRKELIIERTLSKNKKGKIIMGTSTKTGLLKKRQHKSDVRYLPFQLFDEKEMISILEEQILIAKNNKNNKEHLLFCRNDGSYIDHKQITTIFKKICRNAKIKLDLEKGCHFHMTRHTFTTRCIEAGMDLLMIAKLLGHVDTKQIEKTYGHILAKYRNRNLNKLNSYYIENNIIEKNEKTNTSETITISKDLYLIFEKISNINLQETSFLTITNLINEIQNHL